jgi:hypothetical protein
MPKISFQSFPVNNSTQCTLILQPFTACGAPLIPGDATVLNCGCVGIYDINDFVYFASPADANLSPPMYGVFDACSPTVLHLTVFDPSSNQVTKIEFGAAGKLVLNTTS